MEEQWYQPDIYINRIKQSKHLQELLGSPFLLKMFVETLPLINEQKNLGTLDIYDKFEQISHDRELAKQTLNIGESKYTVKDVREFLLYSMEVAS